MDFSVIFEAILALIAVIITGYLVPYIKSKTSSEEQSTITAWIDVAVAAAEQLFGSGTGTEKLEYVQNYLEGLGIEVSTAEIESSVYWLTSAVTEGLTLEVADE